MRRSRKGCRRHAGFAASPSPNLNPSQARAAGRCRAVGTINFCEGSLKCILESAKTKPALNYIMEVRVRVRIGR